MARNADNQQEIMADNLLPRNDLPTDFSAIQLFRDTFNRFPRQLKCQFWILFGMASFSAALDTLTLGLIALFASSIAAPQLILKSSKFVWAQEHIAWLHGFDSGQLVALLGVLVIAFTLFRNIVQAFFFYSHTKYLSRLSGVFAAEVLTRIFSMPYQWFIRQLTSDVLTLINWARATGTYFGGLFTLMADTLFITFMLAALLLVNPVVILLVLTTIGILALLIFRFIKPRLDRVALVQADLALSVNRRATRAIHGYKDIRTCGRESTFLNDFGKDIFALPDLVAKQRVLSQIPGWFLETIGLSVLCLAAFLMYFVLDSTSASVTGTLALVAVSAWKGLPAFIRILAVVTKFRNHLPLLGRMLHFFNLSDPFYAAKDNFLAPKTELAFTSEFRLDSVRFQYEGTERYVLDSMNLDIPKGKTTGLIGKSGAGKSTLVDMIIGLLSPTEGRLLLDGAPLEEEQRTSWLRSTGYVPQAPYIADGSLAENVAFGCRPEEIDRSRVADCCRMAAIDDFLDDLPQGIDTDIGERGVRLSGGQQQRVCIARALYTNPKILIFDEATSSLDSQSERSILDTIYSFKGMVTMVMVAHRLSTVERCDWIYWIENGKVRMSGLPDEVLPLYRRELMRSFREEPETTQTPTQAPSA